MEKIKQVTLSFKKWQQYAVMAAVLLLISFLMASTIPEYVRYEESGGFRYYPTFMQFWHVAFSAVSGIGCVVYSGLGLHELFFGEKDG